MEQTPGLRGLLLSHGGPDRAAHLREDADLLDRLLADAGTRVVAVRGDRVLVAPVPAHSMAPTADPSPAPADGVAGALGLVLRSPSAADGGLLAVFLGLHPGEDGERTAYLGVVEAPTDGDGDAGWQTLRAAGALLPDLDASLAATLLALANWHRSHERCSRCGAPSEPTSAGWVRRCTRDGSQHFPRTDPSVIMSVIDDDGRLLLGRGATWPANQFSVLAGFVEPGESLEAAVAREVLEESGVVVTEVSYLGSQPWPFPSSLMLGFTARAVTTALTHDPTEMAEVRWVTRAEYAALLRSGAIRVPGSISIARRIIERWLGADLEVAAGHAVIEGWRPTT
jgi:NAD+ diphosphatase